MGFWDDNPETVPGQGGNFIKFDTPGVECGGTVTGMDVHTWAPRANPKTGVMETKRSPVVLFRDEQGNDKSVTLPTHAARLAFENRLDVGDQFRLRFTHQEGTTKKFVMQVRKGTGQPALQAQAAAAAGPAYAQQSPTQLQPGQSGQLGQDASGHPQIQAPAASPAQAPWGQPADAPAQPALPATGTDGAPW